MHGVGGEDGTAQELLEILGIPFTGPGAAACARCIDKVLAKHDDARPPASPPPTGSPSTRPPSASSAPPTRSAALEEHARLPARGQAEPRRLLARRQVRRRRRPRCPQALVSAFSYDDRVLLERFVERARAGGQRARRRGAAGRRGDPAPRATATTSRPATRSAAPTSSARPSSARRSERAVTEAALATYRALGCAGFARVDLILGADGPQVLEANAIPGLTDTSLLPQAAEAAGLSFEQLVERILDLALAPSAA